MLFLKRVKKNCPHKYGVGNASAKNWSHPDLFPVAVGE
jgi:hypothetical protein